MTQIKAYSEKFKTKSGLYFDENKYGEELQLDDFYLFNVLDFGATVGNEVFKQFEIVLNNFNQGKYSWPIPDMNEGIAYIIASKLYDIGCIEYGTSIRGSWITEKGKMMLIDFIELSK